MENRIEGRFGKKSIVVFFVIVIILSAVLEGLYIAGGPEWLILPLMWTPAIAAGIAHIVAMRERGEQFTIRAYLRGSGFKCCKFRYILMGWLIPLVYLLIPYIMYWIIHPDGFAYRGVSLWLILKDCMPMMVIGVFISFLSAVGEELGWRGFLVPALTEKIGLRKMILVTGAFWCLWHFPLLIGGGYMEGTPLWYQLPAFVLCIFPVSVIMAVLTLESGSVLPAAFLHAAHNNYDQSVFQLITRGTDKMYFVSETGVITIVCAWVIAIICYVMYRSKHGVKYS